MIYDNILTILLIIFCVVRCHLSNELYPPNSLTNPGDIYHFGGKLPTPRIRHIVEVVDPFVVVYGGLSENNTLLDDINIYDTRFQSWTGVVSRLECCNQAEEIIERLGSNIAGPVSSFSIGFQGGIPPARADHGASVVGGLLYVFGGLSSFGYMNDFFHFDVITLNWTTIRKIGKSWPCRRAGHAMISDDENIYIFGGRFLLADGKLATLNDVWIYDIQLKTWRNYPLQSTLTPLGRQYAATTIHYNQLWVFGGIDSPTGHTFSDLWSYDLKLHQWTQRTTNSGSASGFIPSPLHHAHLVASPSSPSLFLFGGISSGGNCGNKLCNPLSQSFYGQVYRYNFTVDVTSPPRFNTDDSIFVNKNQNVGIGDGSWSYARLSSNEEWGAGGSGKYLKKYALESIGYDRSRGLMYEFGGVDYPTELLSAPESTNSIAYFSISSIISNEYHFPIPETRTGEGIGIQDAGGILRKEYWDLYTGEQLRSNIDYPSVPDWWYDEFLTLDQALDSNKVQFRKEFHEYIVRVEDIVLIRNQNE